jgi:phosphoribosylamine---glycine ligase
MGAYAPAPVVTPEIMDQVKREIIEPVLKGLREESRTYRGVLYCGLMIKNGRARVVEFNVRFGDPEAQVVIPLIEGDFAELLLACATGKLKDKMPVKSFDACAVTVVMSSQGYPDQFETGKVIEGLDQFNQKKEIDEGVAVFHAATKTDEHGHIVTSGGRVLSVTAVGFGNELKETIASAYRGVNLISFDGAYYRNDIGQKALKR